MGQNSQVGVRASSVAIGNEINCWLMLRVTDGSVALNANQLLTSQKEKILNRLSFVCGFGVFEQCLPEAPPPRGAATAVLTFLTKRLVSVLSTTKPPAARHVPEM